MSKHIQLGQLGEDVATQHLTDVGYKVVARNWRYKKAEIDIIAMLEDTMVFVEVKTRRYVYLYEPEESVNHRKQDLLISAAGAYMRLHDHDWAFRFDIITIIHENNQRFTLKHLEDAFEPRLIE